jgi:hypothetical protein
VAVPLDEVLMTLVVEFLFFLEHTDSKDLAPTVAQRMEEEIAFQLGRVDPDQLGPFVAFVRRQASESAWPEERAFLEALPGYLGWDPPSA